MVVLGRPFFPALFLCVGLFPGVGWCFLRRGVGWLCLFSLLCVCVCVCVCFALAFSAVLRVQRLKGCLSFCFGPFFVTGNRANMDASFRAAATFFKRAPQQLGHKAKVVRLYRHSLKAVVSWAVDRDLVNSEASRIRGLFEENRNASPDKASRLIREAQEKLHLYTHPDKYVVPYMPGGSKFMRNAPPALEVRRVRTDVVHWSVPF